MQMGVCSSIVIFTDNVNEMVWPTGWTGFIDEWYCIVLICSPATNIPMHTYTCRDIYKDTIIINYIMSCK